MPTLSDKNKREQINDIIKYVNILHLPYDTFMAVQVTDEGERD